MADTAGILLDVGATRAAEKEAIDSAGTNRLNTVPFGCRPGSSALMAARLAMALDPTWATTLMTATMVANCAPDDKKYLRRALLQVASIAVAWIEQIDNRED